MSTGIYTIISRIDNKIYVGCGVDIEARFAYHKCELNKKRHPNRHLQSAWNKYRIGNFEFEILEECNEDFLFSQENFWANTLNCHNPSFGYNIAATNPYGKPRVKKESIQKRTNTRKQRAIERGYWVPPDYVEKLKTNLKGKPVHPLMTQRSVEATRKPVRQISKSGILLCRYESQAEAGRLLGINDKNINSVVLGKRLTAGGFVWE
jgi:group I intron endonuclease